MNGFHHYIPTPTGNFPDRLERTYTGYSSVPFNVQCVITDLFDGKVRTDYMSRTTFESHAVHAAFIGAGWADVYFHSPLGR